MIWSVSWKNIWRNKRRSLVVIAAVTIGIISGVLLVGIYQGWTEQRLHDAIYNEVSHIQVHNKDYVKNEEIDLTVKNAEEITRCLDSSMEVSGWAKRTRIIAMAGTPWANTGVVIYGVDPEKEKRVSEIYKKILSDAGAYLDSNQPREILISDKTAETLKIKNYLITDSIVEALRGQKIPESSLKKLSEIRDVRFRSPKDFREALKKILTQKELNRYGALILEKALDYRIRNKILVTLPDEKGTPVQGVFKVCGIYKTTNSSFDQISVFVNAGELESLCGSHTVLIHEVAVLMNNMDDIGKMKEKMESISPGNSVMTWKELAPDAAMMNDFMILYYFLFIGIIMLALAFGIINTMLMAILERTRELGMLMAIGMNRRRIFIMIMMETVFLTIVGALAGMVSGWVMIRILGETGIHFSGWGEGFEAIGFAAKVYPVVTPDFFLFITVIVIITAVISSIWPARKALKLNPVEALRTD
jgi:putative ABC transport system permease protein